MPHTHKVPGSIPGGDKLFSSLFKYILYRYIISLESGFIGWSTEIFVNNTGPEFTDGNNFFTVLGVYFPTVTGVMAGINMSGDLKNPTRDMPNGTLAAIGLRF